MIQSIFRLSPPLLLVAFAMGAQLPRQQKSEQTEKSKQPTEQAAPPVRLMSEEKDKLYRAGLPAIDDVQMQEIFADPRLLLYTEAEMPPAYQNWSGDLQGVHSPSYNISAVGSEPFGNGNLEFPWSSPGGTHRAQGVSTFRFLWLPTDADGDTLPVVWFRRRLSRDSSVGYGWRYPVQAVVGEVLMLRGPHGKNYPFEVRVRIREHGDWGVDVYRPFPRSKDLAERIKELEPGWQEKQDLVKLVGHLEGAVTLPSGTLRDKQPSRTVFSQRAAIDTLPAIEDAELVIRLLQKTPFRSALADRWRKDSRGQVTFAPTTEADFHIVPARYDAGFIEVDRESCLRCHNTVNQSVDRFHSGRDWYGRIRGSDGIFSFHPFSPASISHNGYGKPVRMRRELLQAGYLEQFDSRKHPNLIYHDLEQFPE